MRYIVQVLLLCIPIMDLTVSHGGSLPLTLLALIGMVVWVRRRALLTLSPNERLLFIVLAVYCSVSALSIALGGFPEDGFDKFERHLRLLAIVPIYVLLRHVAPDERVLWYGLSFGAIVAGCQALYDVAIADQLRATGDNNSIHFGNISLLMGIMSMAALPWLASNYWLRLLPLVGLIMGLVASFLSGTRGAWLAAPALTALLVWAYWPYRSRAFLAVAVAAGLAIPALLYITPETEVTDRVEIVIREIIQYEKDSGATSVGVRLEMWRVALAVSADHPILGIGLGNYNDAVQPYIASGFAHPRVALFDHPHNEYLATLMSRGLVGLLALLGVLLTPFATFYRAYRSNALDCKSLGLAGLVLITGYIHHGLTNNIFERGVSLTFFAYAVALIAALINNKSCAERT